MKQRNQEYIIAFGKNLQKIRKSKKLSRERLAEIAEIETKQIYRIETGEHGPTLSTIVTIAKALDIHPKKLLDFEF